jgi:hypothetical protein
MTDQIVLKAAVSVAEMARMVGLSRARFYQLMGATFPYPLYDTKTRRPIYVEEMQKVCLEVRRRNCGIDGKPVLFYARGPRPVTRPTSPRKAKSPGPSGLVTTVLDGVKALGLVTATADQVKGAVTDLYQGRSPPTNEGEVIRAVFLHMRRQNSGDKVGR